MSETKELSVDKLKVKISQTRKEMGELAAEDVSEKLRDLLRTKETVNVIFASAPSQNEFLAALSVTRGIDWGRINAFHMDEYIGLDEEAPQRFGHFLKERIFDKVKLRNAFYINTNVDDPNEECRRYAGLLEEYPVDVVCMGIGENTHIAFNDPHVADFEDPLRVKVIDLAEASRYQQVHDGCFTKLEDVPVTAITLTVPALMQADSVYCMVPGRNKASAIYHTIHEEIGERYPSTILRKHRGAILYIDKDSASALAF
ncbi:MAG: glucosamine-6-phosphate deaminase [Chitinophagaceae bacterium]|nr:glucosamine-6-phosphate deaminase [Chitinophagaceae bacterium]